MEEIKAWLESNRPYDAGAKLYLQCGKDPLLRMLFQEDWSAFKQEKLAEVLQLLTPGDIAGKEPSAIVQPVVAQIDLKLKELSDENEYLQDENSDLLDRVDDLENDNNGLQNTNEELTEENKLLKQKAISTPKGWPPVMDATTQQLYDQWKPLFLEKKNLQARITDIALAGEQDPEKEKEAGTMAHLILDLRDACIKIYKKRDFYLANKKLPEEMTEALPNLVTDPKKHPTSLANHQRYLRDYKAKFNKATTDADRQRLLKNIELQQRYVDHYKKMLE